MVLLFAPVEIFNVSISVFFYEIKIFFIPPWPASYEQDTWKYGQLAGTGHMDGWLAGWLAGWMAGWLVRDGPGRENKYFAGQLTGANWANWRSPNGKSDDSREFPRAYFSDNH